MTIDDMPTETLIAHRLVCDTCRVETTVAVGPIEPQLMELSDDMNCPYGPPEILASQ